MIALIVAIVILTTNTIEAEDEVFNGTEVRFGQYPYLVSIAENGEHICSGSIINSNNILTAARCVYETDASTLKIIAGKTELSEGGVAYSVAYYKYHPDFSTEDGSNDIALINPHEPIQFTLKIQPIYLSQVNLPGDVHCLFPGWGLREYSRTPVNNLEVVVVKTVDLDECRSIVSARTTNEIRQSNICTLTTLDNGVCVGDSGSPLLYVGQQVGIASWRAKCARGYPDIFTRTYSYQDWIKKEMFQ